MSDSYRTGPWLVTLAALLWAVDAPFRKYLTADLSSATIVLMEHLVIAVLVLVFLHRSLRELKVLGLREWLAVLFIAWGGSALATVFFTQSFHYVNPSVAILLQKVQPLVSIALAVFILGEKLTKRYWLWAIVGIAGAYLVSFPELAVTGLALHGGGLGVLFALLAAFFWGGSTVFGRYVLRKASFEAMTAIRFLGALVFLFLLAMYYGTLNEIRTASPKDWLFVLIIAALAGFVSLLVYYRGLQFTKASVATIAELAFPFSAVVINWIFLDAALSYMQIAGGALLLYAMTKLSLVNAGARDLTSEPD